MPEKTKPANKARPQRNKPKVKCQSVFIHSLFRSGSTYLFSVFRDSSKSYWCYQEPLNEYLMHIDGEAERLLEMGSQKAMALRHPPIAKPYFEEFYHVRDSLHGLFDKAFSYYDFFISSSAGLPDQQLRYFQALSSAARGTPVFQCCRTFGRIGALKKSLGGTHIHLWREPHTQWWSYKVNNYFDAALQLIYSARDLPDVLVEAREQAGIEPVAQEDEVVKEFTQAQAQILSARNNYLSFYAQWLYAWLECEQYADVTLSIDRLSAERTYRQSAHGKLGKKGITGLDFSQCNSPQIVFTEDDEQFFEDVEAEVVKLFIRHGYQERAIKAARDAQTQVERLIRRNADQLDTISNQDAARARKVALRFMDQAAHSRARLADKTHSQSLQPEWADAQSRIAQWTERQAATDARLAQQEAQLNELRNAYQATTDARLAQEETQLDELRNAYQATAARLEQQTHELNTVRALVAGLEAKLPTVTAILEKTEQALASANRAHEDLQRERQEESQENLQAQARQAEHYKSEGEYVRKTLNKTVEELNATQFSLNESLANAHHWYSRTQTLDAELKTVYQSGSWRITRPLRWVLGEILGLRRVLWGHSTTAVKQHAATSGGSNNKAPIDETANLTPWAHDIYNRLQQQIEKEGRS